ncbi:uncharacterized protein LOC141536733 isoform X1 [Cotesia typhae]|uniref:uncharacterized protein LOC141536733 isoform X1 n=1 Tax=Cotesia typhae TaxID=2053667 RepID=UPI003D694420
MITSRINLRSLMFMSLLIIFNFHRGTSLECYQCESDSSGDCWADPPITLLVTCGEDISTTPNSSTNPTTVSTITTSSGVPTSSLTPASRPTSTGNTKPTTSLTTKPTTRTTTVPITTTAPRPTPTLAPTTNATAPLTPTTSVAPPSNVTVPSRPTTSLAPPTNTSASLTTKTAAITASLSFRNRLSRLADLRADDSWKCIKLISKEGDKEIVNRKCAKKSESFCNISDESSCFACSDDGCNSASSKGFQLISMVLPLAIPHCLIR